MHGRGGTWLPCHTLWGSRMNSSGYCRLPFGLIQYKPSTICHSYWMCIKCFSTLRCYGWAYGCILMQYYMCRLGWILGTMGLWPSLFDVVVSMLRLQTPIDCIPYPYWIYTKSFSTLGCCGWAYGCIIMGPRGASLCWIGQQTPRGVLLLLDLAWAGNWSYTYSYVISTCSRKSRCCKHIPQYGST